MRSATWRIRPRFAVASLTTGLLFTGMLGTTSAGAHHPGPVHYEYQDSSWRSEGGASELAEATPGVPRYYLRADACGGNANRHMSFTAGDPDGGDGCGYIPPGWNALNEAFAAIGDDEGLVHDYPARDGLPFAVDGSKDIAGTVVIQSYRGSSSNPGGLGAGISRAHFTLTGRTRHAPTTKTLGQATVEYLVTPDQQAYDVHFTMPAPADLDGTEFGSLNLNIRLDGPAANHGYIALSGRSFVDIPGTTVEGGAGPGEVPDERLSDVPCVDGLAGPFECDGVDLLGFVPASEIDSAGISDIWGWTDPQTGEEYVMMGKTNGTAFFNVTDPFAPVYLGALPNPGLNHQQWHDIKVFADHAFIVSESDAHGMVVFDLTRLRGVQQVQEWTPDAIYDLNWAAHNIVINEDTGFAYIVGGNAAIVAPDQCLSGLHMVDINDPKNPTFAGCYALDGGPGTAARFVGGPAEDVSPAAYVHDAQCVEYDGPDTDHTGREICFNASETHVAIADVTDKPLALTLGTVTYPNATYVHQGWLTDDKRYWIVNDELDEDEGLVENTRTIVIDVSDLDDPKLHFEHLHETVSPDHNNYVHQGLLYQSNYSSGLRVLDLASIDDPDDPRLEEVAFFDTFPAADDTFDGTWSNYPFFASGTIAVSGRGEGLFLLRLQDDGAPLGVELTAEKRPVTVKPGSSGSTEVTVSNVGGADDAYEMSVSGLPDGWTATVEPSVLSVAAGEAASATVTVEVPAGADPGRSKVTLTATSTTDPTVADATDVTVVVRGDQHRAGTGPSSDGPAAGHDGSPPVTLALASSEHGPATSLAMLLALLLVPATGLRIAARRGASG